MISNPLALSFCLFAFFLLRHPAPAYAKPFTHRTYAQIIDRLTHLANQYPSLLRIYSAQDRFSLPHVGTCTETHSAHNTSSHVPCTIWVVELSNFDTLPSHPDRPEWLVSGVLHGNEVLGPLSALAFIEYMTDGYDKNQFVRRMVNTRLTTIVPMANAMGYEHGHREERQTSPTGELINLDPNRDFGFDQDPTKCMQTVAARTLNELFRVHLFRLVVTFHGGTNALGYEWGDMTHCEGSVCHPAPDTHIMHALAKRMSHNAGPAGAHEEAYPFGDMGKLVYPVHGGLEDWGYGASWAEQAIVCEPTTLGGYSASRVALDQVTKRAITYLVEMSRQKKPDESKLGSSDDIMARGGPGDGHIPRNVRLLLSMIDAVEPYVELGALDVPDDGSQMFVRWTVGGAFVVDSAVLQWCTQNSTACGMSEVQNGTAGTYFGGGTATMFQAKLPPHLPKETIPLYYRIAVVVDQDYAVQPTGSAPDVPPQSHLMGSRASTKWNYHVGDREIRSHQVFFSQTVQVYEISEGEFRQKHADEEWGPDSRSRLYSLREEDLFHKMLAHRGGGVSLVPQRSGTPGARTFLVISVVSVCAILSIALVMFLVIRHRRRRHRKMMDGGGAFTVEDDFEERTALAQQNPPEP